MTVLVTGANGFIGTALCSSLVKHGTTTRSAARSWPIGRRNAGTINVRDISVDTDWSAALANVNMVVHLAARVHVMRETSLAPLTEFRRLNVEGTANLARQAAAAGVRRFVYLSSIKVNGEFTDAGVPFNAEDLPAPKDPYGVSKLEAENELRQISSQTGMEVVIIRPPLVYGPGVKANFGLMMHWVARGVPLPLAGIIDNRRSLVAIDNLVDLIETCLTHPAAANQTFLVSDDDDLSTTELLKRIGKVLGRPARLFQFPSNLLKLGAQAMNKPGIYHRLCGSLQLDITKTCQLLDWSPPVSVDEGLRRTVEGFKV